MTSLLKPDSVKAASTLQRFTLTVKKKEKNTAFDVQKEPLCVNTSFQGLHDKERLASESGTQMAFTPPIGNETLVNKLISSLKSQIDSAGFLGPTEMAENADATSGSVHVCPEEIDGRKKRRLKDQVREIKSASTQWELPKRPT